MFPCTWIATFTGGWPHAGTAIPSDAAIPAACIALNSRTRPGMKKHSMNPSSDGIPLQKKQQIENPQPRAAQIKVMRAKRPQKQRQQDAHHLVAAHRFVLLVEDSLRIWICVRAHNLALLALVRTRIRERQRDGSLGARWRALPRGPHGQVLVRGVDPRGVPVRWKRPRSSQPDLNPAALPLAALRLLRPRLTGLSLPRCARPSQ